MNAISHKPKYKKAIKVMDLTLPLMVGSSYALAVLNAHRHYGRESLHVYGWYSGYGIFFSSRSEKVYQPEKTL